MTEGSSDDRNLHLIIVSFQEEEHQRLDARVVTSYRHRIIRVILSARPPPVSDKLTSSAFLDEIHNSPLNENISLLEILREVRV